MTKDIDDWVDIENQYTLHKYTGKTGSNTLKIFIL